MKGLCTLNELRTVYDLNDLYDMHEVMSLQDEADYLANQTDK